FSSPASVSVEAETWADLRAPTRTARRLRRLSARAGTPGPPISALRLVRATGGAAKRHHFGRPCRTSRRHAGPGAARQQSIQTVHAQRAWTGDSRHRRYATDSARNSHGIEVGRPRL